MNIESPPPPNYETIRNLLERKQAEEDDKKPTELNDKELLRRLERAEVHLERKDYRAAVTECLIRLLAWKIRDEER